MGCKRKCFVNENIHKCCMECKRYSECRAVCDELDRYEFTEDCPDYVKENEDENCKR